MPLFALLLVSVAALTHASWNLLAKKAAAVGAAFVFAYTTLSMLLYAPIALWALLRFGFPRSPAALECVVASGVLHLAYSLVLQRGYQMADLSVVYPVARGIGPTLSAIGAFALLGERATLGAVAGLASVVLGIHPVLLDWTANALRVVFLIPAAWRNRRTYRHRLVGHWWLAVGVGALSPLGYILVLTALRLGAPLHVVAPAREMSMMMGALLGMVLLGERVSSARLVGCGMIVLGVVLLAG